MNILKEYESWSVIHVRPGKEPLSEVVANAPAKTLILLEPGTYYGSILLNKMIALVGAGSSPEDSRIIANNCDCLKIETSAALLRNLTLECNAKNSNPYLNYSALKIRKGKPVIKECYITGESPFCVWVAGRGVDPSISKTEINGLGSTGMVISENAKGKIENCDIHGSSDNVFIHHSNPTIRKCKIHDGKVSGIRISESKGSLIESCDIWSNGFLGISVQGGSPTIRNCKIYENRFLGVEIKESAKCKIEECQISGGFPSTVHVLINSAPKIKRCKIHGTSIGICFFAGSSGIIESCEISNNNCDASTGVEIISGSHPKIRNCRINCSEFAISISDHLSSATVIKCDLTGNKKGSWHIADGARFTSKRNEETA